MEITAEQRWLRQLLEFIVACRNSRTEDEGKLVVEFTEHIMHTSIDSRIPFDRETRSRIASFNAANAFQNSARELIPLDADIMISGSNNSGFLVTIREPSSDREQTALAQSEPVAICGALAQLIANWSKQDLPFVEQTLN